MNRKPIQVKEVEIEGKMVQVKVYEKSDGTARKRYPKKTVKVSVEAFNDLPQELQDELRPYLKST